MLKRETKTKAFRTYVEPIFLSKTTNVFQQSLMGNYVVNVKWSNIVKNEDVFRKTGPTKWSNIIRKRRLKWFAKVIKGDDSAPVKRTFN